MSSINRGSSRLIGRCRILIDSEGNTLETPVMKTYTLMNSKEKTDNPNLEYLGYGECVSTYDTEKGTETPIRGTGYFWSFTKF